MRKFKAGQLFQSRLFMRLLCACSFLLSPLFLFAQTPELTLQTGHTDGITTLAFNTQGTFLASAGKDNMIKIWNFQSGKVIKNLRGHSAKINTIHFINDSILVSASDDGKIMLWNLLTATPIETLRPFPGKPVTGMDFEPGSNCMSAFTGQGHTVFLWKIKGAAFQAPDSVVVPGNSPLTSIKLSKDGNQLFTGDRKNICIFSLHPLSLFYQGRYLNTGAALFGTDNRIYFTHSKALVTGLDTKKKKRIFTSAGARKRLEFLALALDSTGTFLAGANADHDIYIWTTRKGVLKNEYSVHTASVNAILFHPTRNNWLVSAGDDKSIYVWDMETNKLVRKFESLLSPLTAIAANDSGTCFLVSNKKNKVNFISIDGNIHVREISGFKANISGLSFKNQTDTFISSGYDNRISYLHLDGVNSQHKLRANTSGALFTAATMLPFLALVENVTTLSLYTKLFVFTSTESLDAFAISNDKHYTAVGGTGYGSGMYYSLIQTRMFPITISDNLTEKRKFRLSAHTDKIIALSFNQNGQLLASSGGDGYLKIWSMKEKREKYMFTPGSKNHTDTLINAVQFSPVNDSLLFADNKNNIVLLNYKANQSRKINQGHGPIGFDKNGSSVYFQNSENSIVFWNLDQNTQQQTLRGHNDVITGMTYTNHWKNIVTSSWDGVMKLWDASKGEEIASFYFLSNEEFIIKTPDNYYFSSKNAARDLSYTVGLKSYPFEQFDLKYNRPDIVLQRMGKAPAYLIEIYNKAYKKRLKKMNFTEEMLSSELHLPEIQILHSNLGPKVTQPDYAIKIKAVDSKYKLDRINIYVNNVPVYGRQGINLRQDQVYTAEKDIQITLQPGLNKVQVSALNEKGTESLKETFEIEYTTASPTKPNLYIICIGVSNYQNSNFNLNYAEKDANDIASTFQQSELYTHVFSKKLTNQEVTTEQIRALKTDFLSMAGTNDVVIIFIAGHGILDKNLNYYFGTYNIDFNNPEANGLPYDEIEALLDGIKPLHKLIFMDTCHSGEIDKDDVVVAKRDKTEGGEIVFRSAGVTDIKIKEGFGIAQTSRLVEELFSDVRKGTGATVISSAGGAEVAMEGKNWNNGLFTHCLLEGLHNAKADLNGDHKIMISELQKYVLDQVSTLSGGKQVPTSRVENTEFDFRIW